jgi:hypothetical protein
MSSEQYKTTRMDKKAPTKEKLEELVKLGLSNSIIAARLGYGSPSPITRWLKIYGIIGNKPKDLSFNMALLRKKHPADVQWGTKKLDKK